MDVSWLQSYCKHLVYVAYVHCGNTFCTRLQVLIDHDQIAQDPDLSANYKCPPCCLNEALHDSIHNIETASLSEMQELIMLSDIWRSGHLHKNNIQSCTLINYFVLHNQLYTYASQMW